jgi:hypothetical protein
MANYWDTVYKKGKTVGDVKSSDNYLDTQKAWAKLKKDKNNFNSDGSLNVEYMTGKLSKAEKNLMDAIDK